MQTEINYTEINKTLESFEPDIESAQILSFDFALPNCETSLIKQYMQHHFNFHKLGMNDISQILENFAIAEINHNKIIESSIIKLGLKPLNVISNSIVSSYQDSALFDYTPEKMILKNITSEIESIDKYRKMICRLKNSDVAEVIRKIIDMKENHLKILNEIYDRLRENIAE